MVGIDVMSKVMVAWEMGRNLGHLTRDLPLIHRCRTHHVDVFLAVKNLKTAVSLVGGEGITILQAPSLLPTPGGLKPVNFADLLLKRGFNEAGRLESMVQGWLTLIDLVRPDAIIYDYAPSALLAARIAAVPVLVTGTGFEIPPTQSPLPSFRPWEDVPTASLHEAEKRLVSVLNEVLVLHGQPKVRHLADLYPKKGCLLTTYPELDPFGPRHDAEYIGAIFEISNSKRVKWNCKRGKHILVYLRKDLNNIEDFLHVLQGADAEIICTIPEMPADWRQRYPALRLFDQPIDFSSLLPSANLVVTYGGTTLNVALASGIPVLLVPEVGEQYLTGLALEKLGGGLMLRSKEKLTLETALNSLLNLSQFEKVAALFKGRYSSFTMKSAVDRQWDELVRITSGSILN